MMINLWKSSTSSKPSGSSLLLDLLFGLLAQVEGMSSDPLFHSLWRNEPKLNRTEKCLGLFGFAFNLWS